MTRSLDTEAPHGGTLKQACLPYPEVLAQSVSVIAPSTVPAAIVGLIFVTAGNGTWLSFLLGMIGMALVGLNINQFARRSASPGSLYTYIVQGMGPTAGIMGGWALMFAYTLTGMSTLCGFAVIADLLLGQFFGLQLGALGWMVIGAGVSGWVASRNVQLSAKAGLILEGFAILLVTALGIIVWSHKGFAVDHAQLTLQGATPGGIMLGVVLVIFGFSGFESSTSLGEEAKDPLRSIPRSINQSVIISGVFFIFMAYIVVFGFNGTGVGLSGNEAPLDHLASYFGLSWLGTLINIGVATSFFACTLASVNSTARILFSMSRNGLFTDALGAAHAENQTPHVAVAVAALLTLALPVGAWFAGFSAFESQGNFGTMASFGFIAVYVLICLAAPLYLRNIGKLTIGALLCSGAALAFMGVLVVGIVGIPGSATFPLISYPTSLLLGMFALYMGAGLAWLYLESARRPRMIAQLENAVEDVHLRFAAIPAE